MSDKISVIIPVYNAEKTVSKTINSILAQNYKNFEIVVINDGSIDGTKEVLRQLEDKDSRVRVFNKTNGGVSSARNLGIEKATGDYLAFLDADDYYHPNFLLNVLNPNNDINFCFYNNVNGKTIEKVRTVHHIFPISTSPSQLLQKYLGRELLISSSNWIISKKVIHSNNIRFEEDLSWSEDILFFSQCILNANKIGFTREYLTYYVQHDTGTRLSDLNSNRFEYELLASQRLIESVQKSSLKNKEKEKVINLITGYRLPATIVYGLLQYEEIPSKLFKYLKFTEGVTYINGLRSVKLKIFKLKLLNEMREKNGF